MSFFNNDNENNKEEKADKEKTADIDVKTGGAANNDPTKQPKTAGQKESELAIDAFSSGSFVVVRALVGGSHLEDIDVSVTQNTVTIKGSRLAPDDSLSDGFYYQELYWGPFQRKIILPTGIDIDKIDATIHNGMLTVKILKLDRTKEEKVEIKAN